MKTLALSVFLVLGVLSSGKPAAAQSFQCGVPNFGGGGVFVTYFNSTSANLIATQDCDAVPGLRAVKAGDVLNFTADSEEISLSKTVDFQNPAVSYLSLRVPSDGRYTCSTPNQVDAQNFSGKSIDVNADAAAGTVTVQSKADGKTCTFNQCPGFGPCSL